MLRSRRIILCSTVSFHTGHVFGNFLGPRFRFVEFLAVLRFRAIPGKHGPNEGLWVARIFAGSSSGLFYISLQSQGPANWIPAKASSVSPALKATGSFSAGGGSGDGFEFQGLLSSFAPRRQGCLEPPFG